MIIKNLKEPLAILQHEILLKRINQNLTVEDNLLKLKTGFRGEELISYYLKELNSKDFFILFDIRIPLGDNFFQLDVLILSPYFHVILEVKNFYGKLFFDQKHKQMVRSSTDGTEQGFLYPLSQLNRQKRLFIDWLTPYHSSIPPIYEFVVIANPSTIIESDKYISQIIHAHSLIEKIETLTKLHKKDFLSGRTLKRLANSLCRLHEPKLLNLSERYKLTHKLILSGIECSACGFIRMERKNYSWQCPECGRRDRNAHLSGIRDFMLINGKNSISNGEFRDWVGLESKHSANKLLTRSGLNFVGDGQKRIYVAGWDFFDVNK